MKITVRFPIDARNRKAIREAVLLDTYDNGFESAIVAVAERAKSPEQEIFVSRTYSRSGRFSVWIVDQGSGNRLQRRKALQAALGRVRL